MLTLLAMAAFAADPPAPAPGPSEGAPAPATATPPKGAVEAGLSLAVPLPPSGLGPGPGLRILGELALPAGLAVGAEIAARIPGAAAGTLEDDALGEDLEWRSTLTVLTGGARVSWSFGPVEKLHGRLALAGGVAWVSQDTDTQVGRTHDAALGGWVEPQVGGLLPLGPGALTADLVVPIAPANLLVLGPAPGGTAIALVVGYRIGN